MHCVSRLIGTVREVRTDVVRLGRSEPSHTVRTLLVRRVCFLRLCFGRDARERGCKTHLRCCIYESPFVNWHSQLEAKDLT